MSATHQIEQCPIIGIADYILESSLPSRSVRHLQSAEQGSQRSPDDLGLLKSRQGLQLLQDLPVSLGQSDSRLPQLEIDAKDCSLGSSRHTTYGDGMAEPSNDEHVSGTARNLFWELVRLLDSNNRPTESILAYLAKQETREINPHLQDDIRIAWLTVLHAAAGVADAWGYSFWQFFGKTYPKALKAWAERDEINRKALERCAELVREQQAVRLTVPEGKSEGHKNESRLPLYESCKQVLTQKKPRAA